MPRLLAIGDIHGCSRALDALLMAVRPTTEDLIVTLGDYVDRGPDSRGVVERLMLLHGTYRVVSLRGNHELMMQAAANDQESRHFWMAVGGREAMASYSPAGAAPKMEDVPEHHWRFIRKTCVDWFETNRFFFVHANVDPDLPLDEQPSSALHWEYFNHFSPPHCSGKIMLCGHSEQRGGRPLVLNHAICIDTWCYGGGWLTCLDALTGRFWQANQRGETRQGSIEELTANNVS
jgi:serine/threonine protein phosphatase 1